uniref:Reverse transcriptase domain-containing protein n=1 Tax=Anolis carolinensis TaxID=28377 RepID=A0A803SSM5_ANOCA
MQIIPGYGTWRYNTVLNSREEEYETIRKEINKYFETNANGQVTKDIIWDASKAVIRGHCINLYKEERVMQGNLNIREKIAEEDRELLNQPITQEETIRAIKGLKGGKSPGPDGFPAEYYKAFMEELAPHLTELFNEIYTKQKVPLTWKVSEIITIPKKGRDLTQPGSYRPISLCNQDYKIFTKILAKRLETIMPKIIKEDQYGFVKGRKIGDPIKNVVIAMNHANSNKKKMGILKLDVYKAFDKVNHNYLLRLCQQLNMGENFCKTLQQLYTKQLKYIKQDFFENANKPGRWLSRKLREKRESTYINRIKIGEKYYFTEKEIANQFFKFYSKLYEKDKIPEENITSYLGKLKLERITTEEREVLNKEISRKEIKDAIKKLDGSKAPGPDGLSAIYYKTFENELIPHLQIIMNIIRNERKMPDSWKEASITVIHKENTDPEEIKNYRPISLLNIDYKIFSNILAERLKNFLVNWIKEDQVGFLPNRHIKDNIRIVLDLIEYYEINSQREVLFLAIDAEKAFERVNWNFFKFLAQELDMGYYFQNLLEAIYQNQTAKIIVNGIETEPIKIQKGTRQGCPLSPLIFIMSLEILLNKIRENKELQGAEIQGVNYKISAYADDLICFIEEPLKKGGKWIETIKEYGEVAGFKMNINKTKALAKNIQKKKQDKNMEGDKKELETWRNLKISLLGRISTVKMNILPKMIFLFQCLPILRNQKNFINWNRDISKFIWNGKKPRIKIKNLTDEKSRGGLALPNLKLYYEATNLLWIRDWIQIKNRKILNLEGFDLRIGWHAYLWYDRTKLEKNFCNHIIRSALIKTWQKYKTRMHNKTPGWLSPLEASQRRLLGWSRWPKYEELIKKQDSEHILKTQQEIKIKYPNISWLQYGQLKDLFKKDKTMGFMENNNRWDRIFNTERKTISKIYKILLEWDTETEIIKDCMIKWARNIGRSIQLEEWEACWGRKLKLTYSYDLKENWTKMFYRWHITPKRLGLINKSMSSKCWKCREEEGSYFHIWWTCKRAKEFWTKIHESTQIILDKKFNKTPEIYLLGISNFPPDWLTKILEIKNMDRLTFLMSKQQGKPRKETNWQQLSDYMFLSSGLIYPLPIRGLIEYKQMVFWVMIQSIMISVIACLIYLPGLEQSTPTKESSNSSAGLGCPSDKSI